MSASAPAPEPRVPTPGTINVFGADQIVAKVKFTGANAIGPSITMELTNVMFRPNAAVGLIHDEWGQLTLTGEVLADATGIFGTVTHPDTTAVSPLVDMYYIGKGVVEIQVAGDTAYRDIGNVPTFEFTPAVTTLAHYSSRHGVRIKDLEVIHEKAATLNVVMDEFTYDNLMIALLGVAGP
jgi:hypothetical protein